MADQTFGDLRADRHDRVQRAQRVLIDHRHRLAADRRQRRVIEREHVAALKTNAAADHAPAFEIAHHAKGDCRLARAGFADQPKRLALADRKRHIAHGVHRRRRPAVIDRQVFNAQERVGAHADLDMLPRETKSRSVSPASTVPTDRSPMARHGKMTSHGASCRNCCPSRTIRPQAGVGGVTPMPR